MKFAVILALSTDRRSGRLLSGVLIADQAISQVKQSISAGKAPDARFPNLQAVALTEVLRQHRFQVTQAEIEEAGKPVQIASGQVTLGDLIPVEIGEGEDMVIINVTTQEEADWLKGLSEGAMRSVNEVVRLQGVMSESLSTHEASIDAAKKELATCFENFDKLRAEKIAADAVVAQLKTDLEQRETVLQARQAELESCQVGLATRDQSIRKLEEQLAEAVAKAKKK